MIALTHFSRLIQTQAQKYGARTALSFRDYERKEWKNVSWTEFAQHVEDVSQSLIAIGVKEQENLAVFSQNMPDDFYLDFGAYGVRAVTIPFYPTSSPAQVKYMVDDAGVRFIFVGEQLQYDTALPILSLSTSLERIIIFDRKVVKQHSDSVSMYFDEFLALGKGGDFHQEVERRKTEAKNEDLANILYTSGTTGPSKGVMLTHEMYQAAMKGNDMVLNLTEDDVFLNFLPFTHVFERGWSYLGLCEGCRQVINLRPSDVLQSLQEVRPTCMSAVPRFWEKMYEGMMERVEHYPFVVQRLFHFALRIGKVYYLNYQSKNKRPSLGFYLLYNVANKTVLAYVRKLLGLDHGNFFPTAGATISKKVETFVHACGINMVAGYGLTESTATVSCGHYGELDMVGSVGRLLPGVELKFADNGEILLKGKTITRGYYHKEKETQEVIDAEGWFHTGDAGYMKNGELYLTDRIKDLYKTSNGKYISPQQIESRLIVDKYIDQIVVIADRYKFVSALIVPAYGLLEKYAQDREIPFKDRASLCKNEAVNHFLMERIMTLQQDLAKYEQVKRFCLLPQPFSAERDEMTQTLKMKRRIIFDHYRDEIEAMYEE